MKILSAPVYEGFGPTLASEYLRNKHGIEASKETVRQWMIEGKLWRAKEREGEAGAYLAAAAEPVVGNWCNGTPASTTGWKGAERSCT